MKSAFLALAIFLLSLVASAQTQDLVGNQTVTKVFFIPCLNGGQGETVTFTRVKVRTILHSAFDANGHIEGEAENFRPHNTFHTLLSGFDYQCGLYYYNVGEGDHRSWDDYVKYGFISAGQGVRWRDAMLGFHQGDVVAAYLKNWGFVGIGQLTSIAKPIREVVINGKPLLSHDLCCKNMGDNVNSDDLCEYVATVTWVKAVARSDAKWKRKARIYTTTHVRASLDSQPATIAFLEVAFAVNMREYVR